MSKKKPSYFIVGAPKCATSALYEYLRERDDVFGCKMKEPHYFANELSDFFVMARTEEDYFGLFSGAREDQLIGEGSVMYLQSPQAIQNILSFNPDAKLIAIVRNPVDATISMHTQNIKSGHEDQADFIDAWNLQEARAQGKSIPKDASDPQMLQYRDLLALGSQLEKFIALVPENQRRIFVYDDLKSNTKAIYDEVIAFLGLPPDGRDNFDIVNPTINHMSPLREKRLSKIKYNGIPLIGPILYFFHRMYIYHIRPVLRPGYIPPAPPKPDAEIYAMLEEYFEPEISKMEKILNRSFDHWFKHIDRKKLKAA